MAMNWEYFKEAQDAIVRCLRSKSIWCLGNWLHRTNSIFLIQQVYFGCYGLCVKMLKVAVFLSNNAQVVVKFLEKNIFTSLGTPKAIISDGGSYFCNKYFEVLLSEYKVKHRITTPYHLQTNLQVVVSKRELQQILKKTVDFSRKDLSTKLKNASWAYWTTLKTPLDMSPYWIVFENACHFLVGLNFDMQAIGQRQLLQLNELDEFFLDAYENAKIYKENTKQWHDHHLQKRELKASQKVLSFNSILKLLLEN